MSLLKIFKKNSSSFPENELEKSLIAVANNPSGTGEFYTKLLWSELMILTEGIIGSNGTKIIEKDTQVQIVVFKSGEVPVFTSANRIFDRGIEKGDVPYMSMRGQDLLEMLKMSKVVLNPYSDYGRLLLPEEIEKIISGNW